VAGVWHCPHRLLIVCVGVCMMAAVCVEWNAFLGSEAKRCFHFLALQR